MNQIITQDGTLIRRPKGTDGGTKSKALAMFAQEHFILVLSGLLAVFGLARLIFANIRRPRISVIDPNDPDIVGDFPHTPFIRGFGVFPRAPKTIPVPPPGCSGVPKGIR